MKKQNNNAYRSSRINWALVSTRDLVNVARPLEIVFNIKETVGLLNLAGAQIVKTRLEALRKLDDEINKLKARQETHAQALAEISKTLTIRSREQNEL